MFLIYTKFQYLIIIIFNRRNSNWNFLMKEKKILLHTRDNYFKICLNLLRLIGVDYYGLFDVHDKKRRDKI